MARRNTQLNSSNQQCQKCLQFGHWTYECKNQRAYVFRPSKTMQLKHPSLAPSPNLDKPPKIPKITDWDMKRETQPLSSSESSDEELPLPPAKRDRNENEKEAGPSSGSDSDSSSSSSDESSSSSIETD